MNEIDVSAVEALFSKGFAKRGVSCLWLKWRTSNLSERRR